MVLLMLNNGKTASHFSYDKGINMNKKSNMIRMPGLLQNPMAVSQQAATGTQGVRGRPQGTAPNTNQPVQPTPTPPPSSLIQPSAQPKGFNNTPTAGQPATSAKAANALMGYPPKIPSIGPQSATSPASVGMTMPPLMMAQQLGKTAANIARLAKK